MRQENRKQTLAVFATFVLWGLLPVFWKQLSAVHALYVLSARIVWCTVLSGAWLLYRGKLHLAWQAMREKKERRCLMAASVFLCINWGCYIWAVNAGHLMDSSLAYFLNPLLTVVFGTVLLKERLGRLQWCGVGIAAAGVLGTVISYRHVPWLALVIGGAFSLYGLCKKTVHSEAAVTMFLESLLPAPLALLTMLWMDGQGVGAVGALHGAEYLLLPLSGLVTGIPLMLYAWGIKGTPYTLSGTLMYINPILQLMLSLFVYREPFTRADAVLYGFVLAAVVLYLVGQLREMQKEKH